MPHPSQCMGCAVPQRGSRRKQECASVSMGGEGSFGRKRLSIDHLWVLCSKVKGSLWCVLPQLHFVACKKEHTHTQLGNVMVSPDLNISLRLLLEIAVSLPQGKPSLPVFWLFSSDRTSSPIPRFRPSRKSHQPLPCRIQILRNLTSCLCPCPTRAEGQLNVTFLTFALF